MSERDNLLRAIRENPEDDNPRLIFADWCDDNGDAPRAELIRTQIAISRIFDPAVVSGAVPHVCGKNHGAPICQFCVMSRKPRELIDAHGYGWCDGLLGDGWDTGGASKSGMSVTVDYHRGLRTTGHFTFEFSRGFISTVTCSRDDYEAHGETIMAREPVRDWRIQDVPHRPAVLTARSIVGESPIRIMESPPGEWILQRMRFVAVGGNARVSVRDSSAQDTGVTRIHWVGDVLQGEMVSHDLDGRFAFIQGLRFELWASSDTPGTTVAAEVLLVPLPWDPFANFARAAAAPIQAVAEAIQGVGRAFAPVVAAIGNAINGINLLQAPSLDPPPV